MKVYKAHEISTSPHARSCLLHSRFYLLRQPSQSKMVSYKGFNVKVASQIDAHPLPEFSTAHGLGASSTVACYIPIYPGAQIWIEYSVDRPQPSEAIYVFKLFISGHFVTSWVCARTILEIRNADSVRIVPLSMVSKGRPSTACIRPRTVTLREVLLGNVRFSTIPKMSVVHQTQEITV